MVSHVDLSFLDIEGSRVLNLAPLFFDLDHTLWDFESNSRLALRQGHETLKLVEFGVESVEDWIGTYEKINAWCWAQFRKGLMDKSTLRSERFALSLADFGVKDSDLADQLGAHYIETSPYQTALIEGTMEVLEELLKRGHAMWLLTNGFEEVQHLKVEHSGLTRFFRGVYTSDALGVKKPDPLAFERAAALANVRMDCGVIMIGDSWESDVEGAQNVGWRGVHFNPQGELKDKAWKTIHALPQLLDLPLVV